MDASTFFLIAAICLCILAAAGLIYVGTWLFGTRPPPVPPQR
jgi:hypothetical protein